MSSIVIQQIDASASLLKQVCDLGDRNTTTLGFLPRKVFSEYAQQKTILVALDGDQLAGYLLYRKLKRANRAAIVHLCIDVPYRGQGIASLLFEELKARTLTLYKISLTCRNDYKDANKVWKKLGFHPVKEKPGRGTRKVSELTEWSFDHDHKSLFDIPSDKRKVVIDANIFFEFLNLKSDDKETLALKSDWLQEEIEFTVTPELLHEIARQAEPYIRSKQRNEYFNFSHTKTNEQELLQVVEQLKVELIPKNENDESDLKHVAYAVADPEVSFLVTRDEKLLKSSKVILEKFGLTIIRPVDLLLLIDELSSIEEYRAMRLAGTTIATHRITKGQPTELALYFQNAALEKKADFQKNLNHIIVSPETDCFVVEANGGSPEALYALDRSNATQLLIPLLRINGQAPDKKVLRYLLLQFLTLCVNEGRNVVCISDTGMQDPVTEALNEDLFIQVEKRWFKLSLGLADTALAVSDVLENVLSFVPEVKQHYQIHSKLLRDPNSRQNREVMGEIERIFWPVKILDSVIDTITMAIDTGWAAYWFDSKLAAQTLFGAHETKAFNREGVYYSKAKKPPVSLPGRVLWYVTKDDHAQGTQCIRASSRLDKIIVGKAKDLFKQYQSLGILEIEKIKEMVSNDLDREITVYLFSDTQLFTKPVTFDEWKAITLEHNGKEPAIYSPTAIKPEIFEIIYKRGMQLI